MQRVNRFASYWDKIANSGRFKNTMPLILSDSPFDSFLQLSDSLYQAVGSTWKISLQRLFVLIFESLKNRGNIKASVLFEKMQADYTHSGEKASFELLLISRKNKVARTGVANKRQQKMLQ
jgi:hypothetical protein